MDEFDPLQGLSDVEMSESEEETDEEARHERIMKSILASGPADQEEGTSAGAKGGKKPSAKRKLPARKRLTAPRKNSKVKTKTKAKSKDDVDAAEEHVDVKEEPAEPPEDKDDLVLPPLPPDRVQLADEGPDARLACAALQAAHLQTYLKAMLNEQAKVQRSKGTPMTDLQAEKVVMDALATARLSTDQLLALQVVFSQICRSHDRRQVRDQLAAAAAAKAAGPPGHLATATTLPAAVPPVASTSKSPMPSGPSNGLGPTAPASAASPPIPVDHAPPTSSTASQSEPPIAPPRTAPTPANSKAPVTDPGQPVKAEPT